MKELLKLAKALLSVEEGWGKWARKMIGFLLIAVISIQAWEKYQEYSLDNLRETPISALLEENREKKAEIKAWLIEMLQRYPELKGIWIYSWNDARSLIPVMNVGTGENPVPLGSFGPSDGPQIGAYVLGYCLPLNIPQPNETCPINGAEDSWGIIVFQLEDGPISIHLDDDMKAVAQNISHLLYHRTGSDIYQNYYGN